MATIDRMQKPLVLLPSEWGSLSDENHDSMFSKLLNKSSDPARQAAGNEGFPCMSTDSPELGQTTDLGAYHLDLGYEIIPNGDAFARQIEQVQHEYDLRTSAGLSTPRMAGDFMNLVSSASPQTGVIVPLQSPQANGPLPQYHQQLQRVPYEQMYTVKDKQRVSQACDLCRRRKAKCSGGRPCKRCTERDLSCEYADARSRGRGKTRKRADDKNPSDSSLVEFISSAQPVQDPPDNASTQSTSTQGLAVRTKPRKKKPAPILPYTYKPIYPHIPSPVIQGLHAVDTSTWDRGNDYADHWPFTQYPGTASDATFDLSGPSTGISSPLPSQASFGDLPPSSLSALFDHVPSAVTSDNNRSHAPTQPIEYHNPSGEPQGSVLASSSAPVDPKSPYPDIHDVFSTIAAPRPSVPFPPLGFGIDSPSIFCPSPDFAHSVTTTESSSSTGSPFSVFGTLPSEFTEVPHALGSNTQIEESFVKLLSNSPLFP